MALKLNCIFDQPSVLPEVIRLVEKKAHELNSKKKRAKVEDVYKELRDDGYEIDAESVAFAYEQTTGILGRVGFSTVADVRKFGSDGIKKAIRLANEGDLIKSKIGKLGVEMSVASGIAKTFSTLEKRNDVEKSRLKELEEALRRVASSMLDKKGYKATSKDGFKEILNKLFDYENMLLTGKEAMNGKVRGTMNTIDAVWDTMKEKIDAIKKGIKDKAARDRFDELTKNIQNSQYDLLLGTKESENVIKEILKAAGYTKTVTVKGAEVDVVDWNKAMAEERSWKATFENILRNNGFGQQQSQRIINKLESNYTEIIKKKAQNKLEEINKKKNIKRKVDADALHRVVTLRNVGLFAPKNKQYLIDAMGFDLPQEVADEVSEILDNYQHNRELGGMSNVYTEEVIRSIRNLLTPYGKGTTEKALDMVNDYIAISNASTISTVLNATQNMTSGIMATILPAISVIAKQRNPRVIGFLLSNWANALRDVTGGGVTIREANTANTMEVFQGRGGIADRWTWDGATNIKNVSGVSDIIGYMKAILNTLPQVTATAMDSANKTAIMQAEMIKSAGAVLQSEGKSKKKSKEIIDDILFGKDENGKPFREVWREQAQEMLDNQEGVATKGVKAARIGDELVWHELTKYGVPVDSIKAMMSASLSQAGRNLGHESDIAFSPSTWITSLSRKFREEALQAKGDGNKPKFYINLMLDMAVRQMNMFVGGQANWAVLIAEMSPVGIAMGGWSVVSQHLGTGGKVPLYKQKLSLDDPKHLQDQLETRKKIQSRFERGIAGTLIQGVLGMVILAMMGDGDDDERSEAIDDTFGAMMRDPNTRRLLDKVAPSMLASELAYAYDSKKNKFDEKKISDWIFFPEYIKSPSGAMAYVKDKIFVNSQVDRLTKSWEWAKTDDEKAMAASRWIGGMFKIPYTAWWDMEKNEYKLIENDFQPDEKEAARRKAEFKKDMQSTEGVVDALLQGMNAGLLRDYLK
jgi:hypothetical protein